MGIQEQKNIAILMNKWPNAIFHHGTRKNEVVLRWKNRSDEDESNDESESKKKKVKKNGLKTFARIGLPLKALLRQTTKVPKEAYIAQRCKRVAGRTCAAAIGSVFDGRRYSPADLRYDLARGYLV